MSEEKENVPRGRPSVLQQVRRVAEHLGSIITHLHLRYSLIHLLSHLLPEFSAGTVVARLYGWAGFRVGPGSTFAGPLLVILGSGRPSHLTLGAEVLISSRVAINLDERVTIGDRVTIGPFVRIYTANHPVGPASRRMRGEHDHRPVTIGDGTWLRAGVLVLPGVTIGEGCVVAAGSVVRSDLPANSFAAGNPAVVVRTLPREIE